MLKKTTTMDKLEILENKKWSKHWKRTTDYYGIMYMEERIYILNNKKLKEKILQENHNSVDMEYLE